MDWDLGPRGFALLVPTSLGFGLMTALLAGARTIRWAWLLATLAYIAGGVFTSEVWFGWATEEELQPNVDGLSFDEVLLFHVIATTVVVVIARSVARRRHHRPSIAG